MRFLFFVFLTIIIGLAHSNLWAIECSNDIEHTNTTVFQVLGSGGPIADDQRASSSYLIWTAGNASVLVDIGGGSIVRFAESGASIDDLQAIAITHTHIDHIGDFPALVKSAYFSNRQAPLPVFGPSGNHLFPSMQEYIQNTFTADNATHRYLSGIKDGSNGQFAIPATVIEHSADAITALSNEGLSIYAVGVAHSIVPAIGYVIDINGKKIAIPGDTNADIGQFIQLAKGADILVLHLAIPETATGGANRLHARPSEIGSLARQIQPDQLVISHIMQRAERKLDDAKLQIRKSFKGKIDFAVDLACYVP